MIVPSTGNGWREKKNQCKSNITLELMQASQGFCVDHTKTQEILNCCFGYDSLYVAYHIHFFFY